MDKILFVSNTAGVITTLTGKGRTVSNLVIPNTLFGTKIKSIGDCAFLICYNIESAKISEGITSIGEFAFRGCINLKSITIPKSVDVIKNSAFRDCFDLDTVNYAGTEEEWNKIEFGDNNEWLTKATINFNYKD